jgi:hypothetical protein
MTDLFDSPEQPAGREEAGVKRDRWGRYLLPTYPPPAPGTASKGKRGKPAEIGWTRATTFAKSISDTYALSLWSQRMVAKGLAIRPDLYALAASTPVSDKDTLNTLVEDAKTAANARVSANLGTAMHGFTEMHDRGELLADPEWKSVPEQFHADLRAYAALLKRHAILIDPALIERIVVNPHYQVAGTFDRIGFHDGEPVVVDLKTGRDLTYGWNEIAIQLYLYATSAAMWNRDTETYSPLPNALSMTRALVIHLPVGKATATLYEVDLEPARAAADLCQGVREWRKYRNLAREIGVATAGATGPDIGTVEELVTEVRPPTYAERIAAASSVTELSAVWRDATAAGQWTTELETLGKRRQYELTRAVTPRAG